MENNATQSTDNQGRILVIDNDQLLFELVHYHFSQMGYIVEKCSSMDEFLVNDVSVYRLIIIDIAIDNNSGIQIIDMIHQSPLSNNIPIIICAKADNPGVIISGLNAGADDFITRPFAVAELVARAKALMRRL